jgi:hypothetical protein
MRTKIKNLFAVIRILVFATISFSFAKEIYVFDIDGTLTPTNQPMTKDSAKWFEKFVIPQRLSRNGSGHRQS